MTKTSRYEVAIERAEALYSEACDDRGQFCATGSIAVPADIAGAECGIRGFGAAYVKVRRLIQSMAPAVDPFAEFDATPR